MFSKLNLRERSYKLMLRVISLKHAEILRVSITDLKSSPFYNAIPVVFIGQRAVMISHEYRDIYI